MKEVIKVLVKFNNEQIEAINHYKGACEVIASAGSGKSTVLIERIKTLTVKHGIPQNDILAISFTSKTAKELKSKLDNINLEKVNVGTFHALCLRIMLNEGLDIRGKLVPEWKAENWFKEIHDKPNTQDILGFIGFQKNYMKSYEDEFIYKDSDYSQTDLRDFYRIYEENKSSEGLYDFDDYLLIALDLLKENSGKYTWDFVLVDEHQDSNLIQNEILKEVCQSGNIFVVGDIRQSIYSFRASNLEYFMNFHKYWDNPRVINMFTNYRSTKNIVEMSNKFINPFFKNYEHHVDAQAFNKEDGIVQLCTYEDEEKEAIGVVRQIQELINKGDNPDEIAVLYRLNSQSAFIENELKDKGIDYDITNESSFFKRREVDGIINYLRLIIDEDDDGAMENIFKLRTYPLRYFSNKLIDKIRRDSNSKNISLYKAFINYDYDKNWDLKSALGFQDEINRIKVMKNRDVKILINEIVKSFDLKNYINEKYGDAEEIKERIKSIEILKSFVKNNNLEQFITFVYNSNTKKKSKKNTVKLMTVHSSKGLEWDNVFLIGVEDGVFPHERADYDEEARLFYVGATRARTNNFISQIGLSKFTKEYFST